MFKTMRVKTSQFLISPGKLSLKCVLLIYPAAKSPPLSGVCHIVSSYNLTWFWLLLHCIAVWLSLYFGQLTQVNVMGHVLSETRSSKSASKCAACHLLLILCTVPSAACARTTVARDQPTPATQTVTLPSTAAVSPAWTAPMARVVWCRDGGLCLVVFRVQV